jgi:hypothetical protein
VNQRHTPGPWKIEPCFNAGEKIAYAIESDGGENPPAYIADVMISAHYPKEEVATANARLIAAAPELLEACKMAILSCDDPEYFEKWSMKMRAAIAKATGGEE